MDDPRPSLNDVRARIDAVDSALLELVEERAALALRVAEAKKAAGGPIPFGLRPAREAQVLRRLLAMPRTASSDALVIRIWRELMGESLALQGPFQLSVWGGPHLVRTVELARLRFGAAPPLATAEQPEDALAAARGLGGVAVLSLEAEGAWWGRILAEPKIRVFSSLPCLKAWGPISALAVADTPIEPSGADETFWVTDAPGPGQKVIDALSEDGVAACLLRASGGLKLFKLLGFYQPDDARLKRAPGRLSGVIGAAPAPFDV